MKYINTGKYIIQKYHFDKVIFTDQQGFKVIIEKKVKK